MQYISDVGVSCVLYARFSRNKSMGFTTWCKKMATRILNSDHTTPEFACPKCHGPVDIDYRESIVTSGLYIRVAQCIDYRCGVRDFSHVKAARRQVSDVYQERDKTMKCERCGKDTHILLSHRSKLVCQECRFDPSFA